MRRISMEIMLGNPSLNESKIRSIAGSWGKESVFNCSPFKNVLLGNVPMLVI
ncbi:MAG: hypothetical protein L7W43_04605 [Rubripirellula sp.]|nr:hypothetical protein [Rubripirellula sp.]